MTIEEIRTPEGFNKLLLTVNPNLRMKIKNWAFFNCSLSAGFILKGVPVLCCRVNFNRNTTQASLVKDIEGVIQRVLDEKEITKN